MNWFFSFSCNTIFSHQLNHHFLLSSYFRPQPESVLSHIWLILTISWIGSFFSFFLCHQLNRFLMSSYFYHQFESVLSQVWLFLFISWVESVLILVFRYFYLPLYHDWLFLANKWVWFICVFPPFSNIFCKSAEDEEDYDEEHELFRSYFGQSSRASFWEAGYQVQTKTTSWMFHDIEAWSTA